MMYYVFHPIPLFCLLQEAGGLDPWQSSEVLPGPALISHEVSI